MPYKDKEKQRKYQREWLLKRKASFFSDKRCKNCNSVETLELHHRDPNEKISHNIWSWSQVRQETERRKCDILCYECHIIETKKQLSKKCNHGTISGYIYYKCRCNTCRKAKSLYEYNRRKVPANGS